ncbi:MAG: 3' terminal RNA ribose 2'-O-methyltransferase Hen1 [Alphaproteobacteria bacterium]|nr:3' terminal RNA ribose 2'-O-methyltransferase Hen1 [Alphaproteobacteria bacterium]
MLLTLSTTHVPATDLGFLLVKHPGRVQSFDVPWGRAQVFYPEASEARCTAALLLELDPVALVRGRSPGGDGPLSAYVNDRPYVASSFLSVALNAVFRSAMRGSSKERPELVDQALPLEANLSALPSRGGADLVERLFGPLGYAVEATPLPLDPQFPAWGPGSLLSLRLSATLRVSELLNHLYVLLPVLDDEKHYWVGPDELDKLLAAGEGWLAEHPERERISRRYLKHQRGLVEEALSRLDPRVDPPPDGALGDAEEAALERPVRLDALRREAALAWLDGLGARRILDLGCGEGKLVQALLRRSATDKVLGVDVSLLALERAARRLRLEELPERVAARVELTQGSLLYRDARLQGFEAACVLELIEHLEPQRLGGFEQALFRHARPGAVLISTPNAEYNPRYGLAPGQRRHRDHRFEWSRAELARWARGVAARHGYTLELAGVGPEDPELGPPTQLALFTREGAP